MDLPALISELHFRGFDQSKVDSALRCLVHVYEVQAFASPDVGGILAEDLVATYDMDIIQAASELFLDRSKVLGKEVFRVRWGFQDTAKMLEDELWQHASSRWEEYVAQSDGRYLGFMMPVTEDGARVTSNWKLSRELKWFSVAIPRQGWKVLSIMNDVTEVALRLDLAFGFRPFDSEGVLAPRVLLHAKAYDTLKERKIMPPDELIRSIRLWKFFSEYDVNTTDFVVLMKECGLTLDDVYSQIQRFFEMNLTSQFRDGQYPPFFVNDKKKKEFKLAVTELLRPMNNWLLTSAHEQMRADGTIQSGDIEVPVEAFADAIQQ